MENNLDSKSPSPPGILGIGKPSVLNSFCVEVGDCPTYIGAHGLADLADKPSAYLIIVPPRRSEFFRTAAALEPIPELFCDFAHQTFEADGPDGQMTME